MLVCDGAAIGAGRAVRVCCLVVVQDVSVSALLIRGCEDLALAVGTVRVAAEAGFLITNGGDSHRFVPSGLASHDISVMLWL